MKYYIVKETSVATSAMAVPNVVYNPGDIVTGYTGKGDKILSINEEPNECMIRWYGYKRRQDAMRNWTYNNSENNKYWNSTVEIVECDITDR